MNFKDYFSTHRILQVFAVVGSFAAIYWLREYQNRKVIEIPTKKDAFLEVTGNIFTRSGLSLIDLKLWVNFLKCRKDDQQTLWKWENFIDATIVKQSSTDKFNNFISNTFLSDTELIKNYKENLKSSLKEISKFDIYERQLVVELSNSNMNFVSRFVYIYRRYKFINEMIAGKKNYENRTSHTLELMAYIKEFDCYVEKLKLSASSDSTKNHDLQTLEPSEKNIPKILQPENRNCQEQHLGINFISWNNYTKRMQEEFSFDELKISADAIEILKLYHDMFEMIEKFITEAINMFVTSIQPKGCK